METTNELPLHLLTPQGFDQEFFNMLGRAHIKTQTQAYEETEKLYISAFGRKKYSNFDSYRKSRDFRLKKKTK